MYFGKVTLAAMQGDPRLKEGPIRRAFHLILMKGPGSGRQT